MGERDMKEVPYRCPPALIGHGCREWGENWGNRHREALVAEARLPRPLGTFWAVPRRGIGDLALASRARHGGTTTPTKRRKRLQEEPPSVAIDASSREEGGGRRWA
ncbi:hypothetical protein GUJ93_ZPchr0002g25621 [Zizania palustris]|uniref:Uncharacterized protein n=1 Tax=Zizania palustris TaxID=103762 RepID=A0A8J5SHZ7_ZIZPA|nr:hypothetical protein GUJ93_ZPchr0002g23381 [Zizania palustris]KAG8058371.1 hypothetical protein GUJ93_ZPchr0002g25621 [Zizania palustris]